MKLTDKVLALAIAISATTTIFSYGFPFHNGEGFIVAESLNQCSKNFGEQKKSYVFGILPLQLDLFVGHIQSGNEVVVDENTHKLNFPSGRFDYYYHTDNKVYSVNLQDSSYCTDYESEAGLDQEVIQFDWDGKPPMNAYSGIKLKLPLIGNDSCYIGAEPGEDKIALMCRFGSWLSKMEILEQLRSVLKDPDAVSQVCSSLGGAGHAGYQAKCISNIEQLMSPSFEANHYNATTSDRSKLLP